jgi:hypothetical protein
MRDQGIEWSCSKEEAEAGTNNKLFASVDASYANCQLKRRSHGGYIMFLNHGCVSWESGLHPSVTLSSCEAEYVALCSAVCEVKYLRALLHDLGYPQDEATLIWEDNKAAIMIAENESSSAPGRGKDIDVRFRFVAEAIRNDEVRIRYCPTSFIYADIMTKALTPAKFAELYVMCVESKSPQFADRPISSDESGRREERGFQPCRHGPHTHHTYIARFSPPLLLPFASPPPSPLSSLSAQGAFSSRRRGLLHSVVHSFSFSPSPSAFATPPFFSCNKTTDSSRIASLSIIDR